MISTTSFAKPVVPKTSGEYRRLKKSLRNSTAGYGSALATSYFITQGAEMGVSATLGGLASYAYISLLEDHVDNIENSPFQKQFLAPIGTAAFEMAWNNAPFAFDFDYGATFVGFLAYKFALTTVLYEMVREMLISDSSSSYDTTEKEYNDLSDWDTQYGEVDITEDAPILEPDEQPVEASVG
jgi:hypothetical protein